ncbi:MAG: autotransporter domain-containing protein [Pseudoxanthomonas sp.]
MQSFARPVRSVLAVALAVAALPAFAQNHPYSQTVFIGDSLTDSGHFRPALIQAVGPNGALLGRFTTNPGLVWSEYVADFYGTSAVSDNQGGTNYAVGGARTGTNTSGALGPIPSLATQTANYLTSAGGRADPNALYTVWGGANDLFAVAGGAPAQATITAAVTAQVGVVGTLQTAGARYVLVPTVPDLGVTPQFRAGGAAQQAAGTQLATTYNNALFAGLGAAGLRVIPLDTFHLLQEIVADPTPYGISNVTGTACNPQITASSLTCSPATYASADAPNTYAFADGVHPSLRAHEILGDYALSVLEGPRQIALLPYTASVIGRARADRVGQHVAGKPEADGMRWWGSLRGDSLRYDHGHLYDGIGPAGLFGVDWSRGSLVFGGFGGYGRSDFDFGSRAGSFDESDATLGGFVGWYGDQAWVNAQVSYTWISYDVDRTVQLGPATRTHSGSPDGTNLSVGLSAGYEFGQDAFRHGPVLSVVAQRIERDGYAESDPSSTALAYPDQDFDSLVGSAGWQASYAINENVRPYARLTYDREFESPDGQAFASLQSMPGLAPYAVPGIKMDRDYATLTLGARSTVFGLSADIGLTTTIEQKGGTDAGAFATLSGSF